MSILRSLSRIVKEMPSVGEMITSSSFVKHASNLLLPSSSSSTTTTSIPSSIVLSIEEKEGLLELICLLVRCKFSMDDEEGILSAAMKLEEEANMKEEEMMEENVNEEELEKWNNLGKAATEVVKVMMRKKGKKIGIGDVIEEKKKREEAERREKELEAKLALLAEERDVQKNDINKEQANGGMIGERAALMDVGEYMQLFELNPILTNGTRIKTQGNLIVHHGTERWESCSIGPTFSDV